MYRVYKDYPINNAKYFNFDIYADSLARIILHRENQTPFTIAINGKWGSGKTTLMQTIRNKLDTSPQNEKTRNVKTVWFDAWKYSECDSMLAALVLEILEEMERKNLLDKLKAKILVGSEKVDVLKQLTDLAKILTVGNGPEFEKWFRKTEYQNKLSFLDLFQSYMKTILQTFILKEEDGKYTDRKGVLVIFIDDLDRCPPKKIANVLESINLFLDLEGCFFVIGTDITIISDAIDYQYQGIRNFSGIDYIKKMIQLNFDLPMLKEADIQEFMTKGLRIDHGLEPYFGIILNGLKSNQREIIRFLNSLNLMRILGGSLKGIEYEEELLIKWSVLNFSSMDFIEDVKLNPHLLIEVQEISKKEEVDREKNIQSIGDQRLKEKCSYFSENNKIISVLSRGDKKFTPDNIDTYLFLSNIAPKEVQVEKSSFDDKLELKPGADLMGATLKKADMRRANLRKANLIGTDLTEADLMKADLSETYLRGANLKRANMIEANLMKADLKEADMMEANLSGAYLRGADLKGANMIEANMMKADMTEANMVEAKLTKAILTGVSLMGARLMHAEITEAVLTKVSLAEADLKEADLTGADLTGADLTGADLTGANLTKTDLTGADLTGARFQEAKLDPSTLSSILNCNKWKKAFFSNDIEQKLIEMARDKDSSLF